MLKILQQGPKNSCWNFHAVKSVKIVQTVLLLQSTKVEFGKVVSEVGEYILGTAGPRLRFLQRRKDYRL